MKEIIENKIVSYRHVTTVTELINRTAVAVGKMKS